MATPSVQQSNSQTKIHSLIHEFSIVFILTQSSSAHPLLLPLISGKIYNLHNKPSWANYYGSSANKQSLTEYRNSLAHNNKVWLIILVKQSLANNPG